MMKRRFFTRRIIEIHFRVVRNFCDLNAFFVGNKSILMFVFGFISVYIPRIV